MKRLHALLMTSALVGALLAVTAPTRAQTADEPELMCHVAITMRDGINLYANIIVPGGKGPFPTILTNTIYAKDTGGCAERDGEYMGTQNSVFVPAGYAAMTVDIRGTGSSQGVWDAWGAQEERDAEDVLDWIQAQPWSNGKVGVNGCSALGIATYVSVLADQNRRAVGKPKAVYAAVPEAAAGPDLFRYAGFGPGGGGANAIFMAGPAISAIRWANTRPEDLPPEQAMMWLMGGVTSPFSSWQWVDFHTDGPLAFDGPYWRDRSRIERASQVDIPVMATAAALDNHFISSAALNWLDAAGPESNPVVVISAEGGHCSEDSWSWDQTGYGDDFVDVKTNWWDRWLKGIDNGIDSLPAFNFQPYGSTTWIQADYSRTLHGAEGTEWTPLYIDEGPSGSITSINDGTLSVEPPVVTGVDALPYAAVQGDVHQSMLTYTSPPLEEQLTIAGFATASLNVNFDRTDSMMFAALHDVAPDGTSSHLSTGWLRASMGALNESRSLIGPNDEVVRPYYDLTEASKRHVHGQSRLYHIELLPVAAVLPEGHRLRLTVNHVDAGAALPAVRSAAELARSSGATMFVSRGPDLSSIILLPVPLSAAAGGPPPPAQTDADPAPAPDPAPDAGLPATGAASGLGVLLLLGAAAIRHRRRACTGSPRAGS